MNRYDAELKKWLTKHHPDILKELKELLANPPAGKEDYDLVDHCDDNYSDLYQYYSEYQ